jgi:glycosyltransferase involved in cell wall biosynthesis
MQPKVSIIVVFFNAERTLRECVESILNQEFKNFELILVNDGSTDNSIKTIKPLLKNKKIKLINLKKNQGVSKARNTGIKKAKGTLIAFTDADCKTHKKWLKELINGLNFNECVASGGPNITPENDPVTAKCAGIVLEFLSLAGSAYLKKNSKIVEVKHNPSCNSIYLKSVLKELNGFNESLCSNEDPELDFRLREKGFKISFNPKAIVFHHRKNSVKAFFKQAYWFGRGRMQAIKIHLKMLEWFRLMPVIALILIPLLAFLGFFNQFYWFLLFFELSLIFSFFALLSIFLSIKSKMPFPHIFFMLSLAWFFGYALGFLRGIK